MKSIRATMKKVLTALNYNGCIMVIDHKGVYVQTLGKVVTKHYLKYYQPTAVFNYLNVDEKLHKNPEKYDFVAVDVMESFRDINVLKELVAWLKGNATALERIQKGIPLKLRTKRQLDGWLADHPQIKADIDSKLELERMLFEQEKANKRKSRKVGRKNLERKVLEEAVDYE